MYNVPDPEVLIHHERRIIEIDSNFAGSNASFSFHVIGEDSTEKKIFIESIDEYRAVIRDTSQTSGKTQVRVSNNGLLSYVGEKWILVSKIFSVEAENGNLLKNGLVGHPFELSIVNVDSLRINEIDQMDDEGFVTISTSPRVVILEKNSELGFDLWGDFAKVSGRRVMQKKWGEYKEMLSGKSLLYFYTDRGGLHDIDINLSWPSSITRNVSSNTSESPVNSYIAENITFNMKFDNIVLEPVTNEIVSGTLSELYNPACVVFEEEASFKIEVSGVDSEMVSWRSENNKVKFSDGTGGLSNTGSGYTVTVQGVSNGEDRLLVDIAGYDGKEPTISFSVVDWKDVKLSTYIVKNIAMDSAWVDEDVENMIDTANDILKQVGIRLVRNIAEGPANDDYYDIEVNSIRDEIINQIVDLHSNTGGLELYLTNTLKIKGSIAAAANILNYGILFPKKSKNNLLTARELAHEVMHSARQSGSAPNGEWFNDIYDYRDKKSGIKVNISAELELLEKNLPEDFEQNYYHPDVMHVDIIRRVLEYGYINKNALDIPRGDIYGLDDDELYTKKLIECGYLKVNDRILEHQN